MHGQSVPSQLATYIPTETAPDPPLPRAGRRYEAAPRGRRHETGASRRASRRARFAVLRGARQQRLGRGRRASVPSRWLRSPSSHPRSCPISRPIAPGPAAPSAAPSDSAIRRARDWLGWKRAQRGYRQQQGGCRGGRRRSAQGVRLQQPCPQAAEGASARARHSERDGAAARARPSGSRLGGNGAAEWASGAHLAAPQLYFPSRRTAGRDCASNQSRARAAAASAARPSFSRGMRTTFAPTPSDPHPTPTLPLWGSHAVENHRTVTATRQPSALL